MAGGMREGVIQPREEGTPQGSPLSPLFSNILLDELDKELERRGHRFCRYADDCNIYVRSKAAGERVMESISLLPHFSAVRGDSLHSDSVHSVLSLWRRCCCC